MGKRYICLFIDECEFRTINYIMLAMYDPPESMTDEVRFGSVRFGSLLFFFPQSNVIFIQHFGFFSLQLNGINW